MKKYIVFPIILAVVLLSSCADSYLDREPAGGILTQEQYNKQNTLEGSMRGVYAIMYETGSNHDSFGHRAIDLYTDMLSGDIVLTNYNYGWFYTDEQMRGSTYRTGYLWNYYYRILRNINKVIAAVGVQSDVNVLDSVATYGFPSAGNHEFSEREKEIAHCYAQALTMRGYAYSALVRQYVPVLSLLRQNAKELDTYLAVPLYTEKNLESPQPYSTAAQIYQQVEQDLTDAIEYFTEFEGDFARASKLEADINVARGLLAYAMLNKSCYYNAGSDERNDALEKAIRYASDVIESGSYEIIPNKELLTTGFNDVNNSSWMWGQDVTVETQSGLCSFFGQMDIYSYSYPWAGDTKVIDSNLSALFDNPYTWDGRKNWFNDGSVTPKFKGCPSGKFFSAYASRTNFSTADSDIDREWLSDNVFMRVELMYLIAAEANYRAGDYAEATRYLTMLTDERLDLNSLTAAAEYEEYKNTLSDTKALAKAIEFNWRVELWGEGYALQSFRRELYNDATDKRTRGGNHIYNASTGISPSDSYFTFIVPSGETTYNPNLQEE